MPQNIRTHTGSIFLAAGIENDQSWLKVRDTGIGIPPQMLERIFRSLHAGGHFPLAPSAMGSGNRTGALVRGLVELHGGTVKAFSPGVGLGSEFVVAAAPDVHYSGEIPDREFE